MLSPVYPGFFLVYLCLNLISGIQAQDSSFVLKGKVSDAVTHEPLSFARVWLSSSGRGIYTDIDGKFFIPVSNLSDQLNVSYVGYFPYQSPLQSGESFVNIKLHSKEVSTEEIVIRPGENPAWVIMRKAIKNRRKNDYEDLPAFSYDSYNKVYIYPEAKKTESGSITTEKNSDLREIDSLSNVMHLFLWESVTHRDFRRPNKTKEVILASKTSGMSDMALPLVPADIIDFSSFYKDWVVVLGESYMSPLNSEAISKYAFTILDTTLDGSDSIFTIQFSPSKKNFNGFEGVLHIHSARYALQHIRADLKVQEKDKFISGGKVEQIFSLEQDSVWFPSQLITEFEIGGGMLSKDVSDLLKLRMAARVYLKNIRLGEISGMPGFNADIVETDRHAAIQTQSFWDRYRPDTLSVKEKHTYHIIDSLGKIVKFDRWLYQAQKLTQGKFSWRFLDFDIARILQYNLVEKLRTGVGIQTNEKVSEFFTAGGWAGYGWGDQEWKYGGFSKIHPFKNKAWQFEYRYEEDLLESGSPAPLLNAFQSTRDLIGRNVRLRIMDYQTIQRFAVRTPVLQNWTQEIAFQLSDIRPAYSYLYQGRENYYLNEIIWDHRIAPGEKFIKNGPFRVSMGTRFPVFRMRVTQGMQQPDGLGLDYRQYQASCVQSLNLHTKGKIMYALQGGLFSGNVPYTRLQVFRGNFDNGWPLMSPMSFNTMRYNEFVADRFVAFHFRYDFNNLLFHSRTWHPNLLLEYNAAIGSLATSEFDHQELPFILQAPDKIFQEAGIAVQNLLPKEWIQKIPSLSLIGLGFYYRVGAYTLPETWDNFSFKVYSGYNF